MLLSTAVLNVSLLLDAQQKREIKAANPLVACRMLAQIDSADSTLVDDFRTCFLELGRQVIVGDQSLEAMVRENQLGPRGSTQFLLEVETKKLPAAAASGSGGGGRIDSDSEEGVRDDVSNHFLGGSGFDLHMPSVCVSTFFPGRLSEPPRLQPSTPFFD